MRFLEMCCWAATLVFVLLLAGPAGVQAQTEDAQAEEETATDSLGVWDLKLSSKLSASQAAYSNWTGGGINTFAFTAGVNGTAERRTRRLEQNYDLRLALGFIDQERLRKADDLIKATAALQYEGEGFFATFNPTAAADARTQFAAGFNYDAVPAELQREGGPDREPPVKVSAFMSPGIFTQTVGLTYDPRPWFTQRVGLSAKETFVTIRRLRPLYGLMRSDPLRFEAGLSSTTELDREIFENVRLQSTLGLFTSFGGAGELPDATFENLVTMRVNEWLSVNFEFTTLYDRDISNDLQIKEVLSVGVTYVFL